MSAPRRALIFAAGRGERMRPLTDATPKPLLVAGGKRLIEWHIEALRRAGIVDIVINTAHLAAQFPELLGDGARYGVRIAYSHEGSEPLETGGGMLNALGLLGSAPFLAVNGDTYTDFDFSTLPLQPTGLAHLVLIDNPPQHAGGDFWLADDARVHDLAAPIAAKRLTFSGIGVYRPELLADWRQCIGATPGSQATPPRFPLAPVLRAAMSTHQVSGEHFRGRWTDVGTPERLAALRRKLVEKQSLLPPGEGGA